MVTIKLKKDAGPFKEGQTINVDPASAKALIERKVAAEVKDDAQDAKNGA